MFSFVIGFFTSFAGTAGHELIHKRDPINKIIGTMTFTKYFYSHFLDEHVQGHHRMMGTPEDSNSSRKNESLWVFILREIYMSHTNSWNREVRRIRKVYGSETSYLKLIIYNKMTFYFLIHASIVLIIYTQLGMSSVKF